MTFDRASAQAVTAAVDHTGPEVAARVVDPVPSLVEPGEGVVDELLGLRLVPHHEERQPGHGVDLLGVERLEGGRDVRFARPTHGLSHRLHVPYDARTPAPVAARSRNLRSVVDSGPA